MNQNNVEIVPLNTELYADLSIDELEDRLEMFCIIDWCGVDYCSPLCGVECPGFCGAACEYFCGGDIC